MGTFAVATVENLWRQAVAMVTEGLLSCQQPQVGTSFPACSAPSGLRLWLCWQQGSWATPWAPGPAASRAHGPASRTSTLAAATPGLPSPCSGPTGFLHPGGGSTVPSRVRCEPDQAVPRLFCPATRHVVRVDFVNVPLQV